jgi:oligopeptide/dipeptide ABC transporter ATP-binding protein
MEKRPSEFSGGQRQRISIARGLLVRPELLICDEVVSALDVSIQGQILNLLLDIREKRGLSFLFIAHDLKVACYFCDRIGVMYRGELMEEGPAETLYRDARHPYTRLLFSSAGGNEGPARGNGNSGASLRRAGGSSGPSSGGEMEAFPPGCPFAPRCALAEERCFSGRPELREEGPGRRVRCFLAGNGPAA